MLWHVLHVTSILEVMCQKKVSGIHKISHQGRVNQLEHPQETLMFWLAWAAVAAGAQVEACRPLWDRREVPVWGQHAWQGCPGASGFHSPTISVLRS